MTDINQLILISAISIITVLLTIIGIQVAFILRDVRNSIEKANKILTDTGVISATVGKKLSRDFLKRAEQFLDEWEDYREEGEMRLVHKKEALVETPDEGKQTTVETDRKSVRLAQSHTETPEEESVEAPRFFKKNGTSLG